MAMGEIASLYARVGADVSEFMREMDKVKKETSGFEKSAGLVASGTKLLAAGGAIAVGALATGIGVATKAAMDMEQQMANITATMGLTADQTEQLNALVMDLGLDPNLKVSATEAAAAIEMLGKNGMTMTQIMDGAARSSVLLANATNDDFAMAADVATDVMAQFNISADQMNGAVDQIIGVTQASKFGLEDYALAIAQAGGVAGSVGVSFEDFNAVITATSSSFASGSDAGTSFKTFLQRLVPQSKEAEEMMKNLGLMTMDGASAFFDASGNMKSMGDIAGILQAAFAGLSEEQRINAASTLFGSDAMRTGLALAEAGTDTINQYKTTIGNTSAEDAAATRMDTLKGAWEVFQGVVETLTLSVGNKFLPIARKLVDWTSEMAGKYGPQIIQWAGQFADKLGAIIVWLSNSGPLLQTFLDRVMAWVNPIVEIIAHFVSWKDALAGVIGVLAVFLGPGVIAAIGGFVTAFAPVIAVFVAVVAAVVLLRKAWETNFGGIRDIVARVRDYLVDTFGGLLQAFQQFGQGALQEISKWLKGEQTNFENLKAIWSKLKETAAKLWSDLIKYITDNLPGWVAKLKEWGAAAWEWLVEITPVAIVKLKEWGTALWEWVKANTPEWVKRLAEWAVKAWQWIVEVTPQVLAKLAEWAGKLWAWVVENAPGWARKLGEWGVMLWQWIVDVTPKAIEKLGQWGRELWDWFRDNAPTWARNLWNIGSDMMQGLWEGIKNKWEDLKRWVGDTFSGWLNYVKRFFGIASPSKVFADYGRNIIQGMALGMEDQLPAVNTQLNVLGNTVSGAGAAMQMEMGDTNSLEAVLTRLAGAIERNGLGNRINVNMQGSGNAQSDLAPTVAYLSALYGTN